MTIHCTYIGDLDDPAFDWDDGPWSGNVPDCKGAEFPPRTAPTGEDPFWRVKQGIESGELDGKQVDFGGWVARVNKAYLQKIVDEWYPQVPDHPYWSKQLLAVREQVATLDDNKLYALTAWEY